MSVVKALCMLCVRGGKRKRERDHSRPHARVSGRVEAESVGQMFANRPVDLEGEGFYCPGKTAQLDFASN